MIESIGEPAVRITTRISNHQILDHRDTVIEKIDKSVEERPVESAQKTDPDKSDFEQKAGGFNSDEDGFYFEKYDEHGNVILRIPNEHRHIEELG